MKKLSTVLLLSLILPLTSYAQVKDISVTLSPAAEYTLWDDNAGLEDGVLLGGKVGFGFGEYIELRATYMQALDLKTNFENYGLVNYSNDLFVARDVKLTRWGGEFKANFGTKTVLNPYFTLGAGVQSIQLEGMEKNEQIFATAGLGAKFNIGKRAVFALEAKNTMYNFNAGRRLLTADDKTTFGVTDDDFESERLSNWSAMASLQFYLGGRKPGSLTELDKAYLKSFSGGFSGLRLVFEPGLANIEFDSDSNYRNTWMMGGYVGLDFNNYVGLRGFYYQATKDEQISTDFDELAMYGAEFRARLNVARGITPYLALGGGYLDATGDYLGKDGMMVEDSYFASGGLGINIPLTTGLQAYGGIRAILTSNTNEQDLQAPDQIQTHTMYNFGLRIELGKKAKPASEVYNENLNMALNEQQAKNDEKIAKLKEEYKAKIAQLETDLEDAYKNKDVDKAVEILEEKKDTEKALKEVEAVEAVATEEKAKAVSNKVLEDAGVKKETQPKTEKNAEVKVEESVNQNPFKIEGKVNETQQKPLIQMTPVEFELLIQRILNSVEPQNSNQRQPQFDANRTVPQDNKDEQIRQLNQRIDRLEKLLLDVNANRAQPVNSGATYNSQDEAQRNDMSRQILEKLDELNRKIERNSDKIDMQKAGGNNPQGSTINPSKKKMDYDSIIDDSNPSLDTKLADLETDLEETDSTGSMFSKLKFVDASFFGGAIFGDETFPVAGLRLNYAIENSKIQFVPELFVGFTKPGSFGVSGNGIVPINITSTKVKPYAGAGLGFMSIFGDIKLNTNLIVGTYINLLDGKLYVDFTTRNFLAYNQVSAGYTFNF